MSWLHIFLWCSIYFWSCWITGIRDQKDYVITNICNLFVCVCVSVCVCWSVYVEWVSHFGRIRQDHAADYSFCTVGPVIADGSFKLENAWSSSSTCLLLHGTFKVGHVYICDICAWSRELSVSCIQSWISAYLLWSSNHIFFVFFKLMLKVKHYCNSKTKPSTPANIWAVELLQNSE